MHCFAVLQAWLIIPLPVPQSGTRTQNFQTLSGLLQGNPDCFTLYSALLFFFYFSQQLVFNSVTNCLGPRKFLHSGKLYKAKSNKELYGFLFNDFLLLTQIIKPLGSSGTDKVFSPKSNLQYKMYKTVSAAYTGMGTGLRSSILGLWWARAFLEKRFESFGVRKAGCVLW